MGLGRGLPERQLGLTLQAIARQPVGIQVIRFAMAAQGAQGEVASEGSVEQSRDLTNRNRI